MVIQPNMSPAAIQEIWPETAGVFKAHGVPRVKEALETCVRPERLPSLLAELNTVVGSSAATCIGGG
ncbi:hypothetical protein [Planococcus lenghuensis]|uniref:Uncharacterized protein n=1 Tax=Planococcus lenghuensis TaxID=2213202 RepID=A0A1Q2KVH7_9BACL|nr:hypothetical protein [Planococcus lenghuensis]AQQ52218.1 hypothetical protein B0X71_03210 [Planococcus lenghuensis]